MKLKKTIFISVLLVVAVVVASLVFFVISAAPTSGAKIEQYNAPQKALVVIDIQEDYTGKTAKTPFPYKNSKALIQSVNTLIQKAMENNIHIVYIRQEFDGIMGRWFSDKFANGTAKKGNPGTEIDSRVTIVSTNIFGKPKGDSFSNPLFEKFLIENRINELFLSGLDAEFCVYHTALGALNRNYTVTVVQDAIAIRNEDKLEKMLNTYRSKDIKLKMVRDIF